MIHARIIFEADIRLGHAESDPFTLDLSFRPFEFIHFSFMGTNKVRNAGGSVEPRGDDLSNGSPSQTELSVFHTSASVWSNVEPFGSRSMLSAETLKHAIPDKSTSFVATSYRGHIWESDLYWQLPSRSAPRIFNEFFASKLTNSRSFRRRVSWPLMQRISLFSSMFSFVSAQNTSEWRERRDRISDNEWKSIKLYDVHSLVFFGCLKFFVK